jgi:hypothetical protein
VDGCAERSSVTRRIIRAVTWPRIGALFLALFSLLVMNTVVKSCEAAEVLIEILRLNLAVSILKSYSFTLTCLKAKKDAFKFRPFLQVP